MGDQKERRIPLRHNLFKQDDRRSADEWSAAVMLIVLLSKVVPTNKYRNARCDISCYVPNIQTAKELFLCSRRQEK